VVASSSVISARQQSSVPAFAAQAPVQTGVSSGAAGVSADQPQGAFKSHLAWQMLRDAADSDRARSRSDAISALSLLDSDPHAIAMVAHALQDKEDGIRALAATSLGDMNARSAIPALRKAMDDPSPVVSFAAAQSLMENGRPQWSRPLPRPADR
jgi:HEAT repeat protein